MTTIAQGQHAYIFPEPGQVYRVQATGVATVQVIYGAPSAVITLYGNSQTFGPYDSPAKLRISANTASADYTLLRANYAELTAAQVAGGAVGVLASNNSGGVIEPDGDVPSLGGGGSTTIVNDLTTGGTTSALSAEMGKTLKTQVDGKATTAQGAKADTALQPGALPVGTTMPAAQISDSGAAGRNLLRMATLAEIQSSVSGYVAVATFQDLLAARATAVAGRKFVCAAPVIQGGLQFSRWVYDGTEMRLDGPQDFLVDLAPAVGVLGTSEQFLRKYLLPAGLLQVLRYTQVRFIFAKSGVTDAMSAIRMRIGTAGTSADLAVIGDTALTAPNRQRSIESVFSFPDANTLRFQLTQVAGFGGTAVNGTAYPQQSTIAAGYGSALYLSLTAQMAGSTDVPSSPSIIITVG